MTNAFRALPFSLLAALVLTACGDIGTGPVVVPVASVAVSPDTATLEVGQTRQLAVTLYDSAGAVLSGRTVTWTSSDTTRVKVSPAGEITAVAPGAAEISATSEGQVATARVSVLAPVAMVRVGPSYITLAAGVRLQFFAFPTDSAGQPLSGRAVRWTSLDTTRATVSSEGVVTGVAPGQVTITAEIGGTSGSTTLAIIPVTRIELASVHAGGSHSCGLTTTGEAFCWGENAYGQLGTGTSEICVSRHECFASGSSVPLRVAGGHEFAAVSPGGDQTCALTTDGTPYCWGKLRGNALPGGAYCIKVDSVCQFAPLRVPGDVKLRTIRVGSDPEVAHACGIAADGRAFCWGNAGHGRLGHDNAPQRCDGAYGRPIPCTDTPFPVSGDLTFSQLSAGAVHTCGVATDGGAYCWGSNRLGELGSGTADTLPHSAPVRVVGDLSFQSVSAGTGFTCGVTVDNRAYCWGSNRHGKLGVSTSDTCPLAYGSPSCSARPLPVGGGATLASVSAGDDHACGIAPNGAAYCWGYGSFGQLGTGSTTDIPVPVAVSGGLAFGAISAGHIYTCGLTTSGIAYCWGYDGGNGGGGRYGKLGNGISYPAAPWSSRVPMRVAGQE